MHGSYSEMKAISWVFPQFEFQSRECLFHALDCSMRLLGEIAVLLGVYVLYHMRILYRTRMVCTIRVWYIPYAYGTIFRTIRVRYRHTRMVRTICVL